MSVYDDDLACIYEIRPVIDNDILEDFEDLSGFDNVRFKKLVKTCPDLATTFSLIVRGPHAHQEKPKCYFLNYFTKIMQYSTK